MEKRNVKIGLGLAFLVLAGAFGILTREPLPVATDLNATSAPKVNWRHFTCIDKYVQNNQVADFAQARVEFDKRENDRVFWRVFTPERPVASLAIVISVDPDRADCGYKDN